MNRVIKFRAWDGEKMVSVNDIVFSGKESKAYWRENSVTETSSIIQQFTGLTDKNGKEIYEGDILMCDNYYVEIRFRGGQFIGYNSHYAITETQNRNWLQWELFGNIYENPELLKP